MSNLNVFAIFPAAVRTGSNRSPLVVSSEAQTNNFPLGFASMQAHQKPKLDKRLLRQAAKRHVSIAER
jgi:hypothetical protein